MSSARKDQLTIVSCLLCYLYVITDATKPNCEDLSEKCQCHSTYTNYNEEVDGQPNAAKNCLKAYSKKSNWYDADKTCQKEYSNLLHNPINSSLLNEFTDKGIDLIWIGIRRKSGFYITLSDEESSVFKESNREWGRKWDDDEPVYDCVALHIPHGYLVTRPCSAELEFICQNRGFPVYPVAGTLTCPVDWLFFYHLPSARKKCIKAFKRRKTFDDSSETCLNMKSNLADLEDYFSLHSHMSQLNITGYGFAENDNEFCVSKIIQYVLGSSLRSSINCSDTLFICEQDARNITLTAKILPDLLDSVLSTDSSKSLLTCDVSLDGKNINGMKNQFRYVWFKDGIPIPVNSHLFQIGFYPDPIKTLSSHVIRQGTYQCGVLVEGLQGTYVSPGVNFFYSDVETFILSYSGKLNELEYRDFSEVGFKKFLNSVFRPVSSFPNLVWDFQEARLDENNASIKLLLYIERNGSFYHSDQEEIGSYPSLNEYFVKRKPLSKNWASSSAIIQSAGVCFEETVSSSESSYNDVLVWKDTIQTKLAVSEPMCLNGWKLVTRECKPSVTEGARWLPFNYSMCTKYQPAVKDYDIKCPEGFRKLEQNLCYAVFNDKRSLDKAEGICQNSSSFLMDLKVLNNTRLLSVLETSTRYWLSNGNRYKNFESSDKHIPYWFLSHSSLNHGMTQFHCISVNQSSGELERWSYADCIVFEKLAFVCIHQPVNFFKSIVLSKLWYKSSYQNVCYHIDNNKGTWIEGNEICQSLPVNSSLLQSVQKLDDYSLFKILLSSLPTFDKVHSWWMNLLQDQESLKWMSSPTESVSYVDWTRHTDFSMQKSGGVLTSSSEAKNEFQWSLKDLSSKEGFICETQDCKDTRPTFVYIEDRTVKSLLPANYSVAISNFNLHCVPSGWFVSDSLVWFKDDLPMPVDSKELSLSLKVPTTYENILSCQGYYWCSVAPEKTFKRVFSSKVLLRVPDWYTFVLLMKLEIPDYSNCSHVISQRLKPAFDRLFEHLYKFLHSEQLNDYVPALLKSTFCVNSELHSYSHLHVSKKFGEEKEVKLMIESIYFESKNVSDSLEKLQVNIKNLSLRSTVECSGGKTYCNGHELTWPTTPMGQSTLPEEICITDERVALERKCLGDFITGVFWSSVEKSCSDSQSLLSVNLHKLSKVKITEDNILNSSVNMQRLTTSSDELTPIDIQYVAKILKNMASVPVIKPEVLSSVINTVDNVINMKYSTSDVRISLSGVSSKITAAMERIVSNVETNGQVFKEAGNNIAISVLPFNASATLVATGGLLENWSSNVTTLFNDSDKQPYTHFETFEAAVLLPGNLVVHKQMDNGTGMSIIIHKNFHFVKDIRVVSPVIDVSVGGDPVYDVHPPVEMIFRIPEVSAKDRKDSFQCVYWDLNLNDNSGGWSYKGCYPSLMGSTHVQCFCNHLTSFAVILELHPGSKIHKVHQTTLSIITYIGCSLSVFGLGMIILTFMLFRKWRKDGKHKVLFNLSLALICFLLTFLIGIEKRGSIYGCMTVAVILHYFMLASFAWMLVEAFMQYLSLVKVIGTYIPRFMQKAMMFAWGMPLAIVGIILSINYDLYKGNHRYCWLSDSVFYFAVATPILSMLALNFVIFGLILYSNTCGRTTKYLRTNQDERQEMIARSKAVFCVSVLLGLSWVFGFLAVDGAKLLFQYLFAITTTLQGFLIFVFFVLRQKSTRDLWLNLMTPSSTPDVSRISHITGGTEVASRGSSNGPRRMTQDKLSKVVYKARLSYISFNE